MFHLTRIDFWRGTGRAVLAAVVLSLAVPGASFAAKRKNALENWSQEVLPAGEDSICKAYEKRMGKYIETMTALRGQIAASGSGPPRTVLEMFQSLSGQTPESSGVTAAKKRLEKERKAADQLNKLLQVTNCHTVDLDTALKAGRPNAQEQAAPPAPEKMEEILRVPH